MIYVNQEILEKIFIHTWQTAYHFLSRNSPEECPLGGVNVHLTLLHISLVETADNVTASSYVLCFDLNLPGNILSALLSWRNERCILIKDDVYMKYTVWKIYLHDRYDYLHCSLDQAHEPLTADNTDGHSIYLSSLVCIHCFHSIFSRWNPVYSLATSSKQNNPVVIGIFQFVADSTSFVWFSTSFN